jgi:hypothetical protein
VVVQSGYKVPYQLHWLPVAALELLELGVLELTLELLVALSTTRNASA